MKHIVTGVFFKRCSFPTNEAFGVRCNTIIIESFLMRAGFSSFKKTWHKPASRFNNYLGVYG